MPLSPGAAGPGNDPSADTSADPATVHRHIAIAS